MWLAYSLVALLVSSALGTENTERVGKDFKGTSAYSTYYPTSADSSNSWSASSVDDGKVSWSSYPDKYVINSYPNSISENCASGIPAAMNDLIHTGKFGVKAGLAALIAAMIAKLPILLVIKALIFKLIVVPFGFLAFALPVLLPMLYMMMPGMMNMMGMGTTTTTAAPPTNTSRTFGRDFKSPDLDRVIRSLLSSHKCLEQIACKLGARDTESNYRKPITWLLKTLQSMVPEGNTSLKEKLHTYRQAYILGASNKEDVCDQRLFPCDTPQLWVKQNKKVFKLM